MYGEKSVHLFDISQIQEHDMALFLIEYIVRNETQQSDRKNLKTFVQLCSVD